MTPSARQTVTAEARSGLDPWTRADLPAPPTPRGLEWLKVTGPGVIVLGAAIGSGEFLLGPAAFVRHGLSLLWVVGIAVTLQTIFNTEVMRYTLATGEPVFTGFMRTRPSSTLWAWVYVVLYFLQVGWPAWAGTAAGAIFFLFTRRLAAADDASAIYLIGVVTFLLCVVILSVGRRIERTLELLNWILVVAILGSFLVLAALYVPAGTWAGGALGLTGFDAARGTFDFFPPGTDLFLLGALVAYSGAGGVINLVLSNWARDRGYGMGERAGYIPCAVGGQHVALAHSGFMFDGDAEGARRWRGWWRVISADQWGVFFTGSILGMILPAMIYVTFLPRGTDIQGLGISAALAQGISAQASALVGGIIAFLGAWILFKTQLDQLEGMTRAITDILWTGSSRLRSWRGGDVRAVYYCVLAIAVLWGIVALRLAQPFLLLQIGANMAGLVLVVGSVHLLYVNTRLLPEHVRPPMWRRLALVASALFYGFFVVRSFGTLLG
ncbi:MAG TPA: Nramp family divalent metal transporter [Burkholderiales bacterium]|nr:Nramp family divalent metal transporter [Burkholderiales bacterium]